MKKKQGKTPHWSPADHRYMEMAFAEARKAKGRTLPNPPVGAVLVKRGVVLGKGGTRPAGQAHAEIVALEKAGEKAKGGTLYVTLEPCSHHGRTPPCADAVIAAGIREVVVAVRDKNPLVGGDGIRALKKAGIEVRVGLMEDEAASFYEGFFHRIRKGKPQILVKIAQSLDGRINGAPGIETAITGEQARKWTHGMRSRVDAIVIGGGTLRADDPDLTPRLASGPAPDVIVLSRKGPLPADAKVFAPERASKTVVVGESREGLPAWVEHVPIGTAGESGSAVGSTGDAVPPAGTPAGSPEDRAALAALLALFDVRGYHSVLVEGGRSLWKLFLSSGKWDRLFILTAPKVFPEGERWDTDLGRDWGKSLKFRNLTPFGSDFLTEFGRSDSEG
jgi:diaminohydroxyphosphoribosylaminopyrimidine deaminase/5-amino-6-(5-phosphoribosylamino)uracil reductase